MTTSGYVVVLTTLPEEGAEGLAKTLVEERLAACVNVLAPMRSVYRWKGDIETATERQLIIKTTFAKVADLAKRLQSLHPYDVPEFLVIDVEAGSPAYLSWLGDSVN